jgi:hypothetical protein
MVSAKSSPNLVKPDPGSGGVGGGGGGGGGAVPLDAGHSGYSVGHSPVKAAKSSPDLHSENAERERQNYRKRPSLYEQQVTGAGKVGKNYGAARYSLQKDGHHGHHSRTGSSSSGGFNSTNNIISGGGNSGSSGDFEQRLDKKAKRYSDDMYTSDMSGGAGHEDDAADPPSTLHVPRLSLHKYQPDYENVAALATAPLQSEKISEIDDLDDAAFAEGDDDDDDDDDDDAPVVPPRPACVADPGEQYSHNPPIRDPSSLKYIKVRIHESHSSSYVCVV